MLISVCSTVADVSSQPTPSSTAKYSTRDENHKPRVRNGRHSTARPFECKWFWNGKNPAELRGSCVIYALSIKCNDCLMVWTYHQISWGLPHQTRWHGRSFATGGEKRVCWRNLKETDSFEVLGVDMRTKWWHGGVEAGLCWRRIRAVVSTVMNVCLSLNARNF